MPGAPKNAYHSWLFKASPRAAPGRARERDEQGMRRASVREAMIDILDSIAEKRANAADCERHETVQVKNINSEKVK
jgi:hypothetical protein